MVPKAGRKRGFTYMNMNVRVISLSGLDVNRPTGTSKEIFLPLPSVCHLTTH